MNEPKREISKDRKKKKTKTMKQIVGGKKIKERMKKQEKERI